MSRPKRWKEKGRRESGTFVLLPHDLIRSLNWRNASGNAIKLVIELASQFNGTNNGDLSAPFSSMRASGWKSSGTLKRAEQEALHYGLIEKTRQGGLNRCNLYALTWKPIDECKRKLDVSPTRVASGAWRKDASLFEKKTPVRKSNNADAVSGRVRGHDDSVLHRYSNQSRGPSTAGQFGNRTPL
jgi:hypothetical protein